MKSKNFPAKKLARKMRAGKKVSEEEFSDARQKRTKKDRRSITDKKLKK